MADIDNPRTLHFTGTGPWAGQSYCGRERVSTDDYQHPAYDKATYRAQLARLCPDCATAEGEEYPAR